MRKKRVCFISSTGGHLAELLKLNSLFEEYDYQLITEKTKTNKNLKQKYHKRMHYLLYGTQDHFILYLFIFSFNILKSFFYFVKYRPEVVVSTGTHTAIPMCFIAKIFKSKIIWIETLANATTKTKAGAIIYDKADVFIVQWESMLELYPNAIYGGFIY